MYLWMRIAYAAVSTNLANNHFQRSNLFNWINFKHTFVPIALHGHLHMRHWKKPTLALCLSARSHVRVDCSRSSHILFAWRCIPGPGPWAVILCVCAAYEAGSLARTLLTMRQLLYAVIAIIHAHTTHTHSTAFSICIYFICWIGNVHNMIICFQSKRKKLTENRTNADEEKPLTRKIVVVATCRSFVRCQCIHYYRRIECAHSTVSNANEAIGRLANSSFHFISMESVDFHILTNNNAIP